MKAPAIYSGCLTGDCPHERQAQCDESLIEDCPYGKPGHRLWVREAFHNSCGDDSMPTHYRADDRLDDVDIRRWTPSIHMPRWASRILLEVTAIRAEQLCRITTADAEAEGWPGPDAENSIRSAYPIAWFAAAWDRINGPGAYDANPWVWVVEFRQVPRP